MTSSNSIFYVVFNRFCRDKIFTMDTQFKDLVDPIGESLFTYFASLAYVP